MNSGNVGETGSEKLNKEVRGAGSTDSDGGASKTLKAEPTVTDEGTCVAA